MTTWWAYWSQVKVGGVYHEGQSLLDQHSCIPRIAGSFSGSVDIAAFLDGLRSLSEALEGLCDVLRFVGVESIEAGVFASPPHLLNGPTRPSRLQLKQLWNLDFKIICFMTTNFLPFDQRFLFNVLALH